MDWNREGLNHFDKENKQVIRYRKKAGSTMVTERHLAIQFLHKMGHEVSAGYDGHVGVFS